MIFSKGNKAGCFFIIEDGIVSSPEIEFKKKGLDCFGEQALVYESNYMFSGVAIKSCKLWVLKFGSATIKEVLIRMQHIISLTLSKNMFLQDISYQQRKNIVLASILRKYRKG